MHKTREVEHSWDWILMGFMIVVSVGVCWATYKVPQRALFAMTVVMMTGLTAYIFYAIKATRGLTYEAGREGITINYGYKKLFIPYKDISSIEIKERPGLTRLAGNEWPGSYSGYFSVRGEKKLALVYATAMKSIIRIDTPRLSYFISPQDNRRFIEKVSQYWTSSQSSSELVEMKPGPHIWQTGSGILLLALNLMAVGVVVAYIYHLSQTMVQIPLHYNLHGEIDRYGSPSELYLVLIGTAIILPVIIVIGDMLSRRGVPIRDATRLLWIPLLTTVFMGVVVLGMV